MQEVLQWVNKFGGKFSPSDDKKIVLPDTPEATHLRIKLLEEKLEHKQLKDIALSKMIDITELELKILIRRNSKARQRER